MPTTYNDQFYTFDPANPPPVGSTVNFVNYDLTDQNDDGDVDRFNGDSVNGSDVTRSWPGDTVTINVSGVGNVTYTGITFYLANGQRVFTPTDGQVLQNGTFVSSTFVNGQGPLDTDDLGPACFTPGTLIETPAGPKPIETLKVGSKVVTLDNGACPVRWIGWREVNGTGRHAPVRFATGAIGNDRPLLVSPQHRVLVDDWRAELLFGTDEVLVPAKHLVDGGRITRAPCKRIEYVHLLFDRHEVVISDGAPTESFHPGDWILENDRSVYAEIAAIFPEATGCRPRKLPELARMVPFGAEARALAGLQPSASRA